EETGQRFADPAAFHDFSVREHRRFWLLLLAWARLRWEGWPDPGCIEDDCGRDPLFPDLRLSYPENLLRADDPATAARTAIVARHVSRPPERISRGNLRERVLATAAGLAELGLGPGDRAVAVAGNTLEAVVAALATTAVGA